MPSINPKGVFISVNKIYTLMKNQHSAVENGGISVTKNLSVRGNFRKVEIFKSLFGQNRKKLNFRLWNRNLPIGQKFC